jgi:hypothetical protein
MQRRSVRKSSVILFLLLLALLLHARGQAEQGVGPVPDSNGMMPRAMARSVSTQRRTSG